MTGRYPHAKPRLLLTIWPCLAATLVLAQLPALAQVPAQPPACPDPLQLKDQLRQLSRTALLQQLKQWTQACEQRADYHALRGQSLLEEGRIREATEALEKALLLDPEQPGAQLDYAQALAQGGQPEPAQALVREVVQRADIDPMLRQWLLGLEPAPRGVAELALTEAERLLALGKTWKHQLLVQATVGVESNFNSATHRNSIDLQLPGGVIAVPLADSEKPVGGLGGQWMADWQAGRRLGEHGLNMRASHQRRQPQPEQAPAHQLTEVALDWQSPLPYGSLQTSLAHTSYRLKTGYTYQGQHLGLRWQSPGECQWSAEAAQTRQNYSVASLDGDWRHLRLEYQCSQTWHLQRVSALRHTVVGIVSGQDVPAQSNRPGGQRMRQEIYLRHQRPWVWAMGGLAQALNLHLWSRFSQNRDTEVYSSLLGPQPTRTRRADVGLGLWQPQGPAWSVGMELQFTRQSSSNPMLDIRNTLLYAGVRWTGGR